jgi:hypothetical protein
MSPEEYARKYNHMSLLHNQQEWESTKDFWFAKSCCGGFLFGAISFVITYMLVSNGKEVAYGAAAWFVTWVVCMLAGWAYSKT